MDLNVGPLGDRAPEAGWQLTVLHERRFQLRRLIPELAGREPNSRRLIQEDESVGGDVVKEGAWTVEQVGGEEVD